MAYRTFGGKVDRWWACPARPCYIRIMETFTVFVGFYADPQVGRFSMLHLVQRNAKIVARPAILYSVRPPHRRILQDHRTSWACA
jgi:hypothetical protein